MLSYSIFYCDPEIQSGKNGLDFLRPVLKYCPDSFCTVGRDDHIPPCDYSLYETAGFNALCVEFSGGILYNRRISEV